MSAPIQNDAGFRYTVDGQDYLHQLGDKLHRPVADTHKQRFRHWSADGTTLRTVTIGSGVQDLRAMIRFDGMTESLRRFLTAARDGADLEYFPSLANPSESYPCTLLDDDGVSLDDQFWWNRRNSVNVVLRRTDGNSWVGVTEGTLFYYTAGNDLPGLTNTRTGTVGPYVDEDGVLQSAAANIVRTDWVYNSSTGLYEPTLLLEAARTNAWTWSEDFGASGDAAWTKTRATITDDATTAPDDASTMDKLVEDGTASNSHHLSRNTPSLTDSTNSTVSCFAKAAERMWLAIQTLNKAGTATTSWFDLSNGATGTLGHAASNVSINVAGNGSYRIHVTFGSGSGGTTPLVRFMLADSDGSVSYSGDGSSGLYLWGIQFETDQPGPSSYVATAGTTDTRNDDTFYADFPWAPQEMTGYFRFRESGTIRTNGLRLFHIGSETGSTDPRFNVVVSGGNYAVTHDNGTTTASVALSAAPSLDDWTEIRVVLKSDGSVVIGQSIAENTETTATDATTVTLGSAWADTRLYLNSLGTASRGFNRFDAVRFAKGVKTMAEMRSL